MYVTTDNPPTIKNHVGIALIMMTAIPSIGRGIKDIASCQMLGFLIFLILFFH